METSNHFKNVATPKSQSNKNKTHIRLFSAILANAGAVSQDELKQQFGRSQKKSIFDSIK